MRLRKTVDLRKMLNKPAPYQWRAIRWDLPPELLLLVLAHVPQKHLWQHCALVCKAWLKASVTLTTSIILNHSSPIKRESLHVWLHKYGADLAILQVHTAAGTQPLLPQRLPRVLPKLQRLDLSNIAVHFTAPTIFSNSSSSSSSIIAPGTSTAGAVSPQSSMVVVSTAAAHAHASNALAEMTALTSLQLQDCTISLKGLSACSNLQHLSLSNLQEPQTTMPSTQQGAATGAATDGAAAVTAVVPVKSSSILGQELQGLLALTSLALSGSCWDANALAAVASCSSLQQIQLSGGCAEAVLSEPIFPPSSLNQLEVKLGPCDCLSQSNFPNLGCLTTLQSLKVIGVASAQVSPAAVSAMTQLTALHMCFMPLTISSPPELPAFAALSSLQDLTLSGLVWPNESDDFTAGDLSALTASLFLTRLDLSEWQVPPSARSGLFPADRLLTGLVHLALGPCWLHSAAAVQQLVKACPNVVNLRLAAITQDSDGWDASYEKDTQRSVCLQGLSQLQHLTSLSLTGISLRKPASWQQLAQLTGLQRLSCRLAGCGVECLPELLRLTACQQLRAVDIRVPHAETHIWITCLHRVSEVVPGSRKVHYHRTPSVPWQLPAVAAQKAAWLCARLAYASASHSSTSAAATAGKDKAALQALLPHAISLCVQAAVYYGSVKPQQQQDLQLLMDRLADLKQQLLQQSGLSVEQLEQHSKMACVQQVLPKLEHALPTRPYEDANLDATLDWYSRMQDLTVDMEHSQQLHDLAQLQLNIVTGKLAILQQLAAGIAQQEQQQQQQVAASTAPQVQQQATSTEQQVQQAVTATGQQLQQLAASTGQQPQEPAASTGQQQEQQQQQAADTAQQQPTASTALQQEQQAAGAGQQQQQGVVSIAVVTGAEAASEDEPPAALADDSDDDMPQLVGVVSLVQTHATVTGQQQQQQPTGVVSMAAATAAEAARAAEPPAALADHSDDDMPQLVEVVESVQQQHTTGDVSMVAATAAQAGSDDEPPAPLADDSDDDMPQLVAVEDLVQPHATGAGQQQQQQQPAGDVSMAAAAAETESDDEPPAPLSDDSDDDMPELVGVVESVQIHALSAVS